MAQDKLLIRGARVNNLKDITVEIPKNKLVVITGLSGSGKSSLAFDTIFAEGQRRYVESLSSYARQFLELQDKPDVDEIRGLTPTIALDQRGISENPRSTVGTITEVADYLRLLFARAGRPQCLTCHTELKRASTEEIVREVMDKVKRGQVRLYAPLIKQVPPLRVRGGEGELRAAHNSPQPSLNLREGDNSDLLKRLDRAGIAEVRLNGEVIPLATLKDTGLPANPFTLDVVVGTFGPKDLEADSEHVRLQILTALELGDGAMMAEITDNTNQSLALSGATKLSFNRSQPFFFSTELTCPKCGKTCPPLEPRNFSFNSPHGACPACTGLGYKATVVPELVLANPRLTLAQGAVKPWTKVGANQSAKLEVLGAVAAAHGFDLDTPTADLPKKAVQIVLYGTGDTIYEVRGVNMKYQGVISELEERYRDTDSDYLRKEIENFMRQEICSACGGARLKSEALTVLCAGRNIAQISALSVEETIKFFEQLSRTKLSSVQRTVQSLALTGSEAAISTPIIKEILARLHNLKKAGLGYLSLDRSSTTLSGGEGQRVRLAVQLGTTLSGVIYVLDEPTVGLHERDTEMLLKLLKEMRDFGNSVIVVEHDVRMMREAEYLLELGPGAGVQGGRIVAQGVPAVFLKNRHSLTAAYLTGKKSVCNPPFHNSPQPSLNLREGDRLVPPLKVRGGRGSYERKGNGKALKISGASAHNLKDVEARIPLGLFVCITGVSGSGKSTLILDILAKALAHKLHGAHELPAEHKTITGLQYVDKVISVDQTPIGRTPRSNPATYTGIFTAVRDLFTEIPEAKLKGFDAGMFSFNVKGGRCESCAGEGYMRIPMQFMPETYVVCTECRGKRYRKEALEITWHGKNIADVLDLSAAQAKEFFKNVPLLFDKLQVLDDVGLGYIRLGQPAPTLSGGEAQRVKLATELSRRATGKTLYILDEPTTGLHFEDVKHLLTVLHRLVDKGNTILVIEHNLDVIKSADWVIDLGPEGGDKGGEVVAAGTPKDICKVKRSYTGQYLKRVLRA